MMRGVLDRFNTRTQYQLESPPIARAKVNDGTLYIPAASEQVFLWTVRMLRSATYRLPLLFLPESTTAKLCQPIMF